MKINEAIQEYLTECEIRKYTPRTLRSYRINLNLFCRWCEEEKGITEMDAIKMPTTRQFAQFYIQKGRKGTYVNGLLKTIKSFLTYIWEEYTTTQNHNLIAKISMQNISFRRCPERVAQLAAGLKIT